MFLLLVILRRLLEILFDEMLLYLSSENRNDYAACVL